MCYTDLMDRNMLHACCHSPAWDMRAMSASCLAAAGSTGRETAGNGAAGAAAFSA